MQLGFTVNPLPGRETLVVEVLVPLSRNTAGRLAVSSSSSGSQPVPRNRQLRVNFDRPSEMQGERIMFKHGDRVTIPSRFQERS